MSHFVLSFEWLLSFGARAPLLVWAIAFLIALTLWMVIEIIAIKFENLVALRRKEKLTKVWEPVFFSIAIGEPIDTLPALRWRDRVDVLAIWCRISDYVVGDSSARLNDVARKLGMERIAANLLTRKWLVLRQPSQVETLLAIRASERLRLETSWEALTRIVAAGPAPLDRYAARALVALDPVRAAIATLPVLIRQGRWARHLVEDLFEAGAAAAADTYAELLLSVPDNAVPGLALVLDRCRNPSTVTAVRSRLASVETSDPEAVAALLNTLSLVGGTQEHELVKSFVGHERWFVRMRAAQALGRCGQRSDFSVLETLLGDSNWYTRYHAARAVMQIPDLGEPALQLCVESNKDRYARDMARHVIAEAAAPAVR